MTTETQIYELLDRKYGGRLSQGSHNRDSGAGCSLEILSDLHGEPWSESPWAVRCYDFRPLSDSAANDCERTVNMVPVLAAYDRCIEWSLQRQTQVLGTVIRLYLHRLLFPVAMHYGCPEDIDLAAAQDQLGDACQNERVRAVRQIYLAIDRWRSHGMDMAGGRLECLRQAALDTILSMEDVILLAPKLDPPVYQQVCQIWVDAAKLVPEEEE
jgi:hypothetical protein